MGAGSPTGPVAAVDCGTNSTRLLVAEAAPDGDRHGSCQLRTVERLMRITRLGQGVDAVGNLASEAIARTAAVLRDYRAVLDRTGVVVDPGHVRVTATSAARDAANRDDLFVAVRGALGVEPELLSGEEEGMLSFLGATSGLEPADGPFLIVDIGGGSTELITGTLDHHGRPHVTGVRSVDIGCVRISEKHLRTDPPTGSELASARRDIDATLASAFGELPHAAQAKTLVGLAGTVAAAAAIDAGIDTYDRDQVHHRLLSAELVAGLTDRLAALPVGERQKVVGLEPERADVIVGGLLVLQSVLATAGMAQLLTSEADILDGLAASLLPSAPR